MIYAAVLAGGVGTRMGAGKPKQYIHIGDKPILIHTVEKFASMSDFEEVLVLCPQEWIEYTADLISKHLDENISKSIRVISGGETRNDTIQNAIRYIEAQGNLDENTIIVTHDAVRPFVTRKIIKENIEAAENCGACDTVIPATDTIVESQNGETISTIPDRSKLYQGQTPQSFKAHELKKLYESLTEDEKNILTDAAKIYVIKGLPVKLVQGEPSNMKITYPYDITVAENILKMEIKNA